MIKCRRGVVCYGVASHPGSKGWGREGRGGRSRDTPFYLIFQKPKLTTHSDNPIGHHSFPDLSVEALVCSGINCYLGQISIYCF